MWSCDSIDPRSKVQLFIISPWVHIFTRSCFHLCWRVGKASPPHAPSGCNYYFDIFMILHKTKVQAHWVFTFHLTRRPHRRHSAGVLLDSGQLRLVFTYIQSHMLAIKQLLCWPSEREKRRLNWMLHFMLMFLGSLQFHHITGQNPLCELPD